VTQADLIAVIAGKLRLPSGRAEFLVEPIVGCLEQALLQGDKIELCGLGTFQIRQYKQQVGRNPRSGATVKVRPKRLPHFKVSKELATRVDQGRGPGQ
jgi:integration host factor subunit beta